MDTAGTTATPGPTGSTEGGTTFNAFVTPTGAGLFAYEPPFSKGSPTPSSSSSPPPTNPGQETVFATGGSVSGGSRPDSSSPSLDAAEDSSSPAAVASQGSLSSSQHQKQEDDGVSPSVPPSEEAQQMADKSSKGKQNNHTTTSSGETSDAIAAAAAAAAGEKQHQEQPGERNASPLDTVLTDSYTHNPAVGVSDGASYPFSAAMGFDATLAATTLSMGNLELRPEDIHIANAQAFLMAQQQQQQQHLQQGQQGQQGKQQQSLLQHFQQQQQQQTAPTAGGMGAGLSSVLSSQSASILAAQQAQQQNPLLAQQQALAQSVYTKYGPQSNGGYPSPLKTPGAPIKTTDSDKGPEGCNLFVFHIPNDMTNLDLYQMFSTFGQVISARIMVDKVTGRSRGFGFVSYNNPDSALQAIEAMNGFVVGHKRLKVEQKKDKSSLGMSGMGGSMGGHGVPPSSFSASDTLSPHGSNPSSMIGSGGTPASLHALQRWQAHLASQVALQHQQVQYGGGMPLQQHQQHQQQLAHANMIQQHQQQQQQQKQQQQQQQQQAGGLMGGNGGPDFGGMDGGEVGPGQGRSFSGGPMAADRSSAQYLAHVAGLYQGKITRG